MGWFDELAAIISKKEKQRDALAKQLRKAATDKKKMKDVQKIVDAQIALDKELDALYAKIPAARKLDVEEMKKIIGSLGV